MDYEVYLKRFRENIYRMEDKDIIDVISYYDNRITCLTLERQDFIDELKRREELKESKRLILK